MITFFSVNTLISRAWSSFRVFFSCISAFRTIFKVEFAAILSAYRRGFKAIGLLRKNNSPVCSDPL